MAGICRVGDKTQGHGSFPPMAITSGSGNVSCNGIPVATIGSSLTGHSDGESFHPATIVSGSGKTLVNGLGVALKNSSTSCGDKVSACSGNTEGS